MIPLHRVILIPLTDKVLENLIKLKTFYIHQVSCHNNKTLLTHNVWEEKKYMMQIKQDHLKLTV
jgi:uncharacterized protein (UPF0248 family)